MGDQAVEKQLADFIAKYTPEIAQLADAVLAKLRKRLPGAVELVYDNYNALAIGFGPTEKVADAIFSVALYPRWVSLFFLQAANLPDPQKLLKGRGKVARHIVIDAAADLDSPEMQELVAKALEHAAEPLVEVNPGRIVIKSISAKQRPRRPGS